MITTNKGISLTRLITTWLLTGSCLIIFGAIYTAVFNVPVQQIRFDEFLILLQGAVFLCAGILLLVRTDLNAEVARYNSVGVSHECKLAAKYFMLFFLAAAAILGLAWLIVTLSPQALESLNQDYARVADGISRQKGYLLDTVFQSPFRVMVYLLGTCILVPMEEEIFFRRLFYSAIRNSFGIRYGVAISSLTFGLVHLSSPILGIVMGVFLALIYEKHRNLLVNVMTHGLVNFFVIIAKDVVVPYFN